MPDDPKPVEVPKVTVTTQPQPDPRPVPTKPDPGSTVKGGGEKPSEKTPVSSLSKNKQ
jgi:hypothetical protein